MVDIPHPHVGAGDTDAFELVKDAYIKYTDVTYKWAEGLDEHQRRAVMGLLHRTVLTLPTNPLNIGKPGLTLYRCHSADGQQKLCFSLKQVEYIQYYIHECRLAEPEWIDYQLALLAPVDGVSPSAMHPRPAGDGVWVPLPSTVLPASDFVDVKECEAEYKATTKHNKHLDTMSRLMRSSDPADQARRDAIVDNNTEGPGLRRGPIRKKPDRDDDDDADLWQAQPEAGTRPTEAQGNDTLAAPHPASPILHTNACPADAPAKATAEATPSPEISNDANVPRQGASLTYFGHAEQAMLIASQGGLARTFSVLPPAPAIDSADAAADECDPSSGAATPINAEKPAEDVSASVGKGVFVSLHVTTWDEDPSVVLDVGYSATWFVENEESEDMMQHYENGHWIVQDYRLTHRNKPDHRELHMRGQSEPVALADLTKAIRRKLLDLWTRSGRGVTYVVTHSADGGLGDLQKTGLAVDRWQTEWQPAGWDFPAYSDKQAPGSTFVVDTSRLFGEIQFLAGPSAMGLAQVLTILFGMSLETITALQASSNAGNKAHVNMLVLRGMAAPDAPSLTELRQRFKDHMDEGERLAGVFGGGGSGDSAALDGDEDDDESDEVGRSGEVGRGADETAKHEEGDGGDDDESDGEAPAAYYVDSDGNEVEFASDDE